MRPRELTEQSLRVRMQGMKLLDQYQAVCKARRLASRNVGKPFDAPSEGLISEKSRDSRI
jgi:hypothetical protein